MSLSGFVETRDIRGRTNRFVLRVETPRSRSSASACRSGKALRSTSAASSSRKRARNSVTVKTALNEVKASVNYHFDGMLTL